MNRCDSSSNTSFVSILNQSLQVKTIDECLKLHGLLCPPEFTPFHETLVRFFKKNFHDEIRRLAMDGMSDTMSSMSRSQTVAASSSAHYASSSYEQSLQRSASSASTARFAIPPIQVGHPLNITPPLNSPVGDSSSTTNINGASQSSKQTPLQRHLAHLARHGINGVSSAPGDNMAATSFSAESPHNSFVHVGSASSVPQASGASSYIGSLQSFGSIKGRLSRFGSLSLSFGRRAAKDS